MLDANHEMDVGLHGWGPPPDAATVHPHERVALYFKWGNP